MAKESLASRLADLPKRNVLVSAVLIVAALLSAVVLLGNAGITLNRWWERHADWRDQEYNRLTALRAGFTREKFRRELGVPVFDRTTSQGRFREETFQRREHWVQIISDRSGTVVVYAVTACSESFNPRFEIVGTGDSPDDANATVELGTSTFTDVLPMAPRIEFWTGVTANVRYHDVFAGGNPSNYKTYVWGLNDACSSFDRGGVEWGDNGQYSGPGRAAPPWVKRVRRTEIVNTYAETAPAVDIRHFGGHGAVDGPFQIGADRILVRTVWNPS